MADNYENFTIQPSLLLKKEDEDIASKIFSTHNDYLYGEDIVFDEEHEEFLKRISKEYDIDIWVQGCYSCSKMWPDEFGGYALFFTKGMVKSITTGEWVKEQLPYSFEQIQKDFKLTNDQIRKIKTTMENIRQNNTNLNSGFSNVEVTDHEEEDDKTKIVVLKATHGIQGENNSVVYTEYINIDAITGELK